MTSIKHKTYINDIRHNFDVSKAEDIRYMFSGCDKMTIPNWYKLYHKK